MSEFDIEIVLKTPKRDTHEMHPKTILKSIELIRLIQGTVIIIV